MLEIIIDTLVDGVKLLPFLFITYLIMEYIEHKTSNKSKELIKKSGKLGPFIGGILGIFPQCGFSTMAASLYAGKIITLGTLISIFLATSDEMLPVLISEAAPIDLIIKVLALKVVIGIVAGFLIDLVMRFIKNKKEDKKEIQEEINNICEHEHCDCSHDGILKSAIKHTLSIFLFIIIISFVLNIAIYFIGEENISNVIINMPIVGPLVSGLIGFIPNCASSVILTQLYLEEVITLGSMMSGLLVGSGVGILILFRVNKNLKDNLKISGILYTIGIICGILIDILF